MVFAKQTFLASALVFALLCALLPASNASNDWKSTESGVLVGLLTVWQPHFAGAGVSRTALDGANVCNLRLTGVTCSVEGRIIGLDLSRRNLQGKIPAELGLLTGLQVLDLSHNQLNGEIPLAVAQLPQLRSLNLEGNAITGLLPSTKGSFPALTVLNLRDTLVDDCPAPGWARNVQECCVFQSACNAFAHCASSCSSKTVARSMRRDTMADEPVNPNVPTPSSKLNSRQIAGIAVGAAIGLVIIGVVIFIVIVETRRKNEPEPQIEMPRRFGHQDSSLTTMDSRRDLSRPNNFSKPPASVSDPEPSSSSSSSSDDSDEPEEVAPPKKPAKKTKAAKPAEDEDAVTDEQKEESKVPAASVGTSQDALLKPKRKKKKAKAAAAASPADEDD